MTACRGVVMVSFGILAAGLTVWASPNIVAGERALAFGDERTPHMYSRAGKAVLEVTAGDDERGRERGPHGAGGMDGLLDELKLTRLVEATREVKPWSLAELCDGDDHHAPYLDVSGPAVFDPSAAGQQTDPRNDLNEDAMIAVTRKFAQVQSMEAPFSTGPDLQCP